MNIEQYTLTRRGFMTLSAASAVAAITGCATNPVTGKKQFMLMSESSELNVDQQNSPHQLSADYGAMLDPGLNQYVASVGNALADKSHRALMPYSFRGVNAVYVNAYAFPGGTIAITRGMLLNMKSEAELAAVMGHEIGHVCSRHTASSMSKGMLISGLVSLAALAVQTQDENYAAITSGLGMVAAGALLARYSRANEREADALALEYMTKAGYNPDGCVDLMNLLRGLSKEKPNVIEMMFATHPMSDERYETTVKDIQSKYQSFKTLPTNRERYMDQTSRLRAIKGAIEQIQNGEKAMNGNKLNDAATSFQNALKLAPQDYVGLLMFAKCRLAQKNSAEAERLAAEAKAAYPGEPQALHVSGMAKLQKRKFDAALAEFDRYEQLLPGNPNTTYFRGYSNEGMGRRDEAATQYSNFLQQVNEGDYAQYAYKRLVEWGYIKPQQPQQSTGATGQ